MLTILRKDRNIYRRLETMGQTLEDEMNTIIQKAGKPWSVNRVGSMLTVFFTDQPVTDYASAKTADTSLFAAYFRKMLDQGIYLPPSQFEAAFLSSAMRAIDINKVLAAFRKAINA